jgi:enoyl-CoA hydratase
MDQLVEYSVTDRVARLTLNSPHNRNALSTTLVTQLRGRLDDAAADPSVRMVVLTHAGRTFCAGADLSEVSGASPEEMAAGRAAEMTAVLRAILECPRPVIGVVDGCDLVLAGPNSTFGLTEARIGVAPAMISLTLLPKLSPRAAGRYFLTGETFDAATAVEIGLVTVAAGTAEDLNAALSGFVEDLRKGSPQGLAASKALTTAPILAVFDRDAHRLATESARLFTTAEAHEGMLAFLQKRPPEWALPAGD